MKQKTLTKRTTIYLPINLITNLDFRANKLGITRSELIRRLLQHPYSYPQPKNE